MNCFESLDVPLRSLHTRTGKRFRGFVRAGVFAGRNENNCFGGIQSLRGKFFEVLTHIELYTKRRLTFDSDSINAISGVLNLYRNSKPKISHCCGIPMILEQFSWTDSKRESIAISLSWRHLNGGTRRPEFPSWSWAGWEGSVQFASEEALNEYTRTYNNRKDYQRYPTIDWSNYYSVLSVRAMVLEAKALSDNIGVMSGFVSVPGTSKNTLKIPFLNSMADDADAMLYLSSRSIDVLEFRTKIECREWECVILTSSPSHLHLMIIEGDGNAVAERVGVLFIHPRKRQDNWDIRKDFPYRYKYLKLK
jgi:hypothetical protein